MAEPGPRNIGTTAAERIVLYQTWSNPVRRRILAHLAEQQLIEEVAERSTGRERWWRISRVMVRTPPRSQMTAEEQAASEQPASLRAGHDLELYLRFTAEYDAGSGRVDGDRFGTTLTRDEVHQFVAEYHALMSKYSRPPHEAPPGARQMAVRFFILPEDPLDSPGQPEPA